MSGQIKLEPIHVTSSPKISHLKLISLIVPDFAWILMYTPVLTVIPASVTKINHKEKDVLWHILFLITAIIIWLTYAKWRLSRPLVTAGHQQFADC